MAVNKTDVERVRPRFLGARDTIILSRDAVMTSSATNRGVISRT